MSGKKLLIVESPTKAKTISRFLSNDYIVESCMGHIRDLPESAKSIPEKYKKAPWKNLGVNIESEFEPIYCVPDSKKKVVKNLKSKLKEAKELILATDEDREGESISWHLIEILKPNKKIPVKRMVFHEITKSAINQALKNFRDINLQLVQAQEARRILDRLVGYTISPILWKKISRGLSAGRVQSVAVKLISDREVERLEFQQVSYYDLEAHFKEGQGFKASLKKYKDQLVATGKDFDKQGKLIKKSLLHLKKPQAEKLVESLKTNPFSVKSLKAQKSSRSPKPPFITSTLQQEANRKLRLSSKQTMSVAQKLYEKGYITYMRTDSTHLSKEAWTFIRKAIEEIYGKKELPAKARLYKTKSKGAQEAHEAIRPAGQAFESPENSKLEGQELALYTLIWQRTLASQMHNCEQETLTLSLENKDSLWQASATQIVSPGFYKVYQDKDKTKDTKLPKLKLESKLKAEKLSIGQHETRPPARYNEASLIQKLEKEGVGRPSTYASIISTIQNRGYVKKINQFLAPTFTAIAVTRFLSRHFPNYVDLKFTSEMEKNLDNIAEGKVDHVKYLASVYRGKSGLKEEVEKKTKEEIPDSKTFSFKAFKDINFHVGRFGAYITKQGKNKEELKASLPEDTFLSDIDETSLTNLMSIKKDEAKVFGVDPKTKENILVKTGRYGPYLELEKSQKRGSIPKFCEQELDLEKAGQLVHLPLVLGEHSETKKEVKKSIGRYGPYVVHDGKFQSVKPEDFFDLDLKQAEKLLAEAKTKPSRASRSLIKEWKTKEGQTIQVLDGKYGPYIKYKKKNTTIPKDLVPKDLTLEACLKLTQGSAKSSKKKSRKKAI